jgi:predicted site-specific integrase-resolvase
MLGMTTNETSRRLMMPGHAAKEAGVTTHTLANWADAGRIRCIRTAGGQRRYVALDIAALAPRAGATPAEEVKVSA